jgi:fucokinase
MAPGSIPKEVSELIQLLTPICHGMALAGAGGGGFLYILTKERNKKTEVQNIIDSTGYHMKLYDAKLAKNGITVEYN